MSKFKVGHVWVTRDGRKARIVATDRKGRDYPVVALVEHADGNEHSEHFTAAGFCSKDGTPHGLDLIREHREPREVWVGVDESGLAFGVSSTERLGAVWHKFREVIE